MILASLSLLFFFGAIGVALLLGIGFLLAGRRLRRPSLRLAAVAWFAYAAWEAIVQLSGAAPDDRGDLRAIVPLLLAVSAYALLAPRWRRPH
jgi:hypothetical protein